MDELQGLAVTEAICIDKMRAELARLRAENERLKEAIRVYLEDDVARPLGSRYRADGVPSKNDRCIHAKAMWEECVICCAAHFERALAGAALARIDDIG